MSKYDETKNKLEYITLGGLNLELKTIDLNNSLLTKNAQSVSRVPNKIDFNSLYLIRTNSNDLINSSLIIRAGNSFEQEVIEKIKTKENDILINKKNEWLKLNKIN